MRTIIIQHDQKRLVSFIQTAQKLNTCYTEANTLTAHARESYGTREATNTARRIAFYRSYRKRSEL